MKNIFSFKGLGRHLPMAVVALCALQPLIDVLAYVLDRNGVGNLPTLLLRSFLLAAMVIAGIAVSQNKNPWYWLLGGLALFTLLHGAGCLYYGYDDPVHDLVNLVRIYQLPLAAFSFAALCRKEEKCLSALFVGASVSLGLIALIGLVATVTGTDPHTYANKSVGLLGWFSTPSAQSAILSMLVPLFVGFFMEKFHLNPLYVGLAALLGFGLLFLFATRLSYASFLGAAWAFGFFCLLGRGDKKKRRILTMVFSAFVLAGILLIPLSPMEKNTAMVQVNLEKKQAHIDTLVKEDSEKAKGQILADMDLRLASLESAYEYYLPGVTGRFGLMQTAEYYDYSTDASVIADARLQKKAYCLMLLQEQPLCVLFGMELGDMTFDGNTYDAENDFHGIFFLCGGVGLLALLGSILWLIGRALWALKRDFARLFTPQLVALATCAVCGLAHAYFTAGLLRRPNASIYFSLCLTAIWYLTQRRKERKS